MVCWLSGGPDSLALTAVAAQLRPTTALIVDHGLQPDSAAVAETARARQFRWDVLRHRCFGSRSVARAVPRLRRAPPAMPRWTATATARCCWRTRSTTKPRRCCWGWAAVREPARSPGMRPYDPPWCRPLLGVRREVTHAACAELGLTAVAGSAQQRPPLHPGPAARRSAAAAGRRVGRRGRGGAGPHRDGVARRHRVDRRDRRRGAGRSPGGAGAGRRGPGRAARPGTTAGDPRLAAGRRRDRADRQADPRRGHLGHRLARPGRRGGRVRRCAVSACLRGGATAYCVAPRAQFDACVGRSAARRGTLWTWRRSCTRGTSSRCCSPQEQIQARVAELGEQIGNDYRDLAATAGKTCC